MASRPRRGSRRVVPPTLEREALRERLLALYRNDRAYQGIVAQTLRPRWLDAWKAVGGDGPVPSARTLWSRREPESHPDAPDVPAEASPVRRYLDRLLQSVSADLGLIRADGRRPAAWAIEAVHADVTARERERRPAGLRVGRLFVPVAADHPMPPPLAVSFTLRVAPTSVAIEVSHPDWDFADGTSVDVGPADGFSFGPEHWTELRREARRLLGRGIALMRQHAEATYPARNPPSLRRQQADLAELVAWLFHRRRPADRKDRKRLRDLSRRLGIRPPGATSQPARRPA